MGSERERMVDDTASSHWEMLRFGDFRRGKVVVGPYVFLRRRR